MSNARPLIGTGTPRARSSRRARSTSHTPNSYTKHRLGVETSDPCSEYFRFLPTIWRRTIQASDQSTPGRFTSRQPVLHSTMRLPTALNFGQRPSIFQEFSALLQGIAVLARISIVPGWHTAWSIIWTFLHPNPPRTPH